MAETIRPFYEILFRFENEKFENIFLQNYYIFLPNYTFFDQIGLTYMLHYMFKLFVAQKKTNNLLISRVTQQLLSKLYCHRAD